MRFIAVAWVLFLFAWPAGLNRIKWERSTAASCHKLTMFNPSRRPGSSIGGVCRWTELRSRIHGQSMGRAAYRAGIHGAAASQR